MVSINIENEDVQSVTAAIGEYPLTLPHLMLLIDGLSILYNSDEFVDFMILGIAYFHHQVTVSFHPTNDRNF